MGQICKATTCEIHQKEIMPFADELEQTPLPKKRIDGDGDQ